jgi:hypothetical protein
MPHTDRFAGESSFGGHRVGSVASRTIIRIADWNGLGKVEETGILTLTIRVYTLILVFQLLSGLA